MMNLKLSICSWILLFIISSSDAENCICRVPGDDMEVERTTEKEEEGEIYSGPVFDVSNPLHPVQICRKVLKDADFDSFGPIEQFCSSNITCYKMISNVKVTLSEIPQTGVECIDGRLDSTDMACYHRRCTFIVKEKKKSRILTGKVEGKVPH